MHLIEGPITWSRGDEHGPAIRRVEQKWYSDVCFTIWVNLNSWKWCFAFYSFIFHFSEELVVMFFEGR